MLEVVLVKLTSDAVASKVQHSSSARARRMVETMLLAINQSPIQSGVLALGQTLNFNFSKKISPPLGKRNSKVEHVVAQLHERVVLQTLRVSRAFYRQA